MATVYTPPQATGPTRTAQLPDTVWSALRRYRWQLAPLAAAGGVYTAGVTHPATAAVVLAAPAGLAYRWAVSGAALRGRMWLSVRERRTASLWAAAAAGWSLAMAVGMPPRVAAGSFAAAMAWPSWRWATSRTPSGGRAGRLSKEARALVQAWDTRVAVFGPEAVRHSRVLPVTVQEPALGAATFVVQLVTAHAESAAAASVRLDAERILRLPVGTVQLGVERDDSTRMRVTLTPSRHLERSDVDWPGPVLERDGTIPLAATPSGRDVSVRLYNATGVEHALLAGTSDAGKSTTTAALLLPGPAAGVETVVFLDGKRGTSAPYLRPACDWYATTPQAWRRGVEFVHAVLIGRQRRRGEQERHGVEGIPDWVMAEETEPIVTLYIEEATSVGNHLSERHHEMVRTILREGRALGVRVVQVTQDAMSDAIVGGRKARDLMGGNGSIVALRPGGSMAERLTLDGTDVDINLRKLPPEPGFCAIVRKGHVLAMVARVRNAHKVAAGEAARKVTVRPLDGDDLEWAVREWPLARVVYDARHLPEDQQPGATGPDDSPTAAEMAESDAVLLRILADGPKRLGEVGGNDDGEGRHPDWRWSRKTASAALIRLNGAGKVAKDGEKWTLADDA